MFARVESVRRLNLWEREVYPERPGLPDCAYYMRTGSCGYGAKCRYNHPRDRSSSVRFSPQNVVFFCFCLRIFDDVCLMRLWFLLSFMVLKPHDPAPIV